MCSRKDSAGTYYIKEEVITKPAELVKLLMQKYNINSDVVLLDFEMPAIQSEEVKLKCLQYSSSYYNTFSSTSICPYLVQVTTSPLNIRNGASTSFSVVGSIKDHGMYTITEELNNWGKLKSRVGWISLDYTKKI